jgi:protocatechuate 3,4-dioxygenase beta subunit
MGSVAGLEPRIPSCVLTPVRGSGPYFKEERLLRSDIRSDPGDGSIQPGRPLSLSLTIVDVDRGCEPVAGMYVDVWHCNASGIYSDIAAVGTVGKRFLRGCQRTDADGRVSFSTIFPGWYAGRAVHVHLKVRPSPDSADECTTQLFFDQEIVDHILTTFPPYSDHGKPAVSNREDEIYGDDGWKLTVPLTPTPDGYDGAMVIGLEGL